MLLTLSELESSGALNELKYSNRGIEKESLRIDKKGKISQNPHNKELGSPLTNPFLTTDFSEALLELITPTFNDPQECLDFLSDIHAFIYKHIDDELLWSCSMPCPISESEEIPIANFGNSNTGMLKTIYRKGLSERYGSMMQAIAGIHYNFSFSDGFFKCIYNNSSDVGDLQTLKNDLYLKIARNFRRYSWLYFKLFGASPSASNSFVGLRTRGFKKFIKDGLYKPNATSLRMGDLGYISSAQDQLSISINSIDDYCAQLRDALKIPYPPYEDIGEFKNKKRVQLNTSIIQIENEYYSTIRPKRICPSGERPVNILETQGIEYLELRCIDLDPFNPIGIDRSEIDFLDTLLLFCLIKDSPPISKKENDLILSNHKRIINDGRDPEMEISVEDKEVNANDHAKEILSDLEELSDYFGKTLNKKSSNFWSKSLEVQNMKITGLLETPSSKILNKIKEGGESFLKFGLDLSLEHKEFFNSYESNNESMLKESANISLAEKSKIDSLNETSFEEYLKIFLSKTS